MLKKAWLLFTYVIVITSIGYTQSSQTGSIVGTALLEDGAAIPGVKVTITSPAMLIGTMTAITNQNGTFRFANLPPGIYEISFQLEGFHTFIRKEIRVSVLQTFTVNASLRQETLQEAVVVTGQGPTVDTQHVTRATNWDIEFLKSMPAPRNLVAFVNMVPGMTGASNAAQTSAFGGSTMDNSYNLDGVNLGDQATGTQGVMFGMDIMDEVSVQSGGLAAEFGSVTGAMINVVTKSGGNKLSGQATMFYNGEKLMSDNTAGTPLAGTTITSDKWKIEPGLSLGGPVIKDKLWFFTSGNLNLRSRFVTGYPYGAEQLAFKTSDVYPYIKLTFQLNKENRFVFSYSGNRYKNDHAGADRYTPEESSQIYTSPSDMFNLAWIHYFGDNLYANFKAAGVTNYGLFWTSKDYALDKPFRYNGQTGTVSGPNWRNRNWNSRPRYNFNADATTFIDNWLGTHEVKFGAEFQYGPVKWEVLTAGDQNATNPVDMVGYWDDYAYGHTNWSWGYRFYGDGFNRQDNLVDYSAFLQDSWRLNKKLSVNIGLRYEYNSIIWPKQGEGSRQITSAIKAQVWNNLSPRLGLIFDLFGDSKTLIKASFSRYTIPNQLGFVNVAHPNGWYAGMNLFMDGVPYYDDWITFWSPSATTIGYKSNKLLSPITDELTIGFEREMFTDWTLGARFIRKWDKRLIHQVDASQLDIDKLMNDGVIEWTNWETFTVTDPYDNQVKTFYDQIDPYLEPQFYIVNPPGAVRNYKGLELTVSKRFSRGWGLNISYVYNDSQGLINTDREAADGEALGSSGLFTNPNAHINNIGHLDLEERHQFKLQALWRGPWGINLSGYFRFLSGVRFTRSITASYLDLQLQNVDPTIYAEQRGSSKLPDYKRLDLRLEKTLQLSNIKLAIFCDVFNVFNANTAVEIWNNSSNTTTYDYDETLNIMAPRTFQIGARIEF
jgi:hypothetical protein